MQFRYDEDLVEEAVFLCAQRRKGIPALQLTRFHLAREKLYRILDPDERNDAFFRLHLEWFREWGLEAAVLERVREFPLLLDALTTLAVRKARTTKEEAAELFVNEAGQRNAVIALRPARIVQDPGLPVFLRHELTHLQDMVDPHFGYEPHLDGAGLNPAQKRLALERYRMLWDITIDGRLAAAGKATGTSRESNIAAFAAAYCFLTEANRAHIFDELWHAPKPAHARLAELASDPRGLRDTAHAVPGASCPLCTFPAFDWVKPEEISLAVAERIRLEFPVWTPEQSLCGRCLHVYRVAISSVSRPQRRIDTAPV
jgi:hypothetical protein